MSKKPLPSLAAVNRELAQRDLPEFIRQGWHVLEPKRPLVWGWVLDAVCDHLKAVSDGHLTRLLINEPPGMMKSLSCRVFWPIWEWLDEPTYRYIGASYAERLSLRDNRRARMLLLSEWFRERWGDDVRLSADQTAKGRFENTQTGWMQATGVEGMGIGERGDRFIIDDPHNTKEAESKAVRDTTLQWFSETVPSRLNDLDESAIVIVMQRLHESDVSGHAIASDLGYEHLMIPMEFEPERKCYTSIGFEDPRTEPGELAFPERFSAGAVEKLKKAMRSWGGTYAEAGQLQQRPTAREGGMFKVENFRIVDHLPSPVVRAVRYWDKAGTEGGGAYTAGVKVAKLADGTFAILDVKHEQLSVGRREKLIKQTAELDGKDVRIWVEQEPGSGGKESAQATVKNLAGFKARADRVTGDKEVRAEPYAAQVEIGNVILLRGDWNTAFIEEHRNFPRGRYKDQVDGAGGGFAKVTSRKSDPWIKVI